MKSSGVALLAISLFAPALGNAQETYRATRSFEEQQAISQIGQAEYYARMALKSLEASEKIGKAPYFNYQSAREDIEKVLAEFKIYLKGDESIDPPPAVPLIVDGRYFAESIKNFLVAQKSVEAAGNPPAKHADSRATVPKTAAKSPAMAAKRSARDKNSKVAEQSPVSVLPPPPLTPRNDKVTRDKIEEILKKGL